MNERGRNSMGAKILLFNPIKCEKLIEKMAAYDETRNKLRCVLGKETAENIIELIKKRKQ